MTIKELIHSTKLEIHGNRMQAFKVLGKMMLLSGQQMEKPLIKRLAELLLRMVSYGLKIKNLFHHLLT